MTTPTPTTPSSTTAIFKRVSETKEYKGVLYSNYHNEVFLTDKSINKEDMKTLITEDDRKSSIRCGFVGFDMWYGEDIPWSIVLQIYSIAACPCDEYYAGEMDFTNNGFTKYNIKYKEL